MDGVFNRRDKAAFFSKFLQGIVAAPPTSQGNEATEPYDL